MFKAVPVALVVATASLAVQAQPIPKEGVIRDTTQPRLAAKAIYDRKYGVAQTALERCAGAHNIGPTERSTGGNTFEMLPHPAVKHAAEVDQPVRATGNMAGQKMCDYVKQPQVTQWYKQNFKI